MYFAVIFMKTGIWSSSRETKRRLSDLQLKKTGNKFIAGCLWRQLLVYRLTMQEKRIALILRTHTLEYILMDVQYVNLRQI